MLICFGRDGPESFLHLAGTESPQQQLPGIAHQRGDEAEDHREDERAEDERVEVAAGRERAAHDIAAEQHQEECRDRDDPEALVQKPDRRRHLPLRGLHRIERRDQLLAGLEAMARFLRERPLDHIHEDLRQVRAEWRQRRQRLREVHRHHRPRAAWPRTAASR